jgi:hypothetical protein
MKVKAVGIRSPDLPHPFVDRRQIMKALVVYESMYGNTHQVADAIAAGLDHLGDAEVLPVIQAPRSLEGIDLLVVGGPTHVHGMSRESTRKAAVAAAAEPDSDLELDPDAAGPGLRTWLAEVEQVPRLVAAFDTRLDGSAAFTGRASKGIARKLAHHGGSLVVPPQSFLVTKSTRLEPHELDRAQRWASDIVAAVHAGAGSTI